VKALADEKLQAGPYLACHLFICEALTSSKG
jgi:hypothetical protein